MDDGSVSEVLQLLHNILGEVRAVKKTVDTHEAKFDDIMLQLRLQQSPDEAAPLKTLPRCASLIQAPRESVCKRCSVPPCSLKYLTCYVCGCCRITCDVEMMAGGSSDEDVTNQRAQGTELGTAFKHFREGDG